MPFSPLAETLGFTRLPAGLVAAIALMIPTYLILLELGKRRFYAIEAARASVPRVHAPRRRRILSRASRWTVRLGRLSGSASHPTGSPRSRRHTRTEGTSHR